MIIAMDRRHRVVCAITAHIVGILAQFVGDVQQSRQLCEVALCCLAEELDRQSVYAQRKAERLSQQLDNSAMQYQGRWDPRMGPLRPRPVVNVIAEPRPPISPEWQEGVMREWTEQEYMENLRMSQPAFRSLVDVLKPYIQERQQPGGKPQTPLWCKVAAALSFLGGGREADFREKYGMRKKAAWASRWEVLHAVCEALKEEIQFPSTPAELAKNSAEFEQYCHFPGAVAAVDGIIIPAKLLGKAYAKSMYCQRKAVYGFNVQAVADAHCRFLLVDTSHFASVHDGRAFRETTLWRELEEGKLRCGDVFADGEFFILGDNAYAITSFLLHPWKGHPALGSAADAFNFHISAARQSVERAFGHLVMAFPVLHIGLNVNTVEHASTLITACFLLHNWRQRAMGSLDSLPMRDQNGNIRYGQFASVEDAMDFVRTMADNAQGGRYRRGQETGMSVRNKLARYLWQCDWIRPGTTKVDAPLPSEAKEDQDGLQG